MAGTSADKRFYLEESWAQCADNSSLRDFMRAQERAIRIAISGGSVKSQGGFQKTDFFDYGPGQITQHELANMWRELITDFDTARQFLIKCSAYGLDPFLTDFSFFPQQQAPVQGQGVLVDSTGRFAILQSQFSITDPLVGAPVGDAAVFCWLMFHEVPCIEEHSNYGQMRIAEGAQFT
jgi:hypothetical protein